MIEALIGPILLLVLFAWLSDAPHQEPEPPHRPDWKPDWME